MQMQQHQDYCMSMSMAEGEMLSSEAARTEHGTQYVVSYCMHISSLGMAHIIEEPTEEKRASKHERQIARRPTRGVCVMDEKTGQQENEDDEQGAWVYGKDPLPSPSGCLLDMSLFSFD